MLNDPLTNFNWKDLYKEYDKKCKGFNPRSEYLLRPEFRVVTDRELYYVLVGYAGSELQAHSTITFETYLAILYWKLYSQPQSTICKRALANRAREEEKLKRLSLWLPKALSKDIDKISLVMCDIGKDKLMGIGSDTALPVRSTLLHFLYPNTVPVFDKMVLKAVVDNYEDGMNQSMTWFKEYVPYNWTLCDKYKNKLADFQKETMVRVIDMALWVSRGD